MFQTAAAYAYARKYKCHWGMPSDTREVPHFRKMFPAVPVLDGNFKRVNRTEPVFFNYDPLPNFNRDITLVGYFQSQKFFEGYDEEIKKMFKLDIQPVDAVSVHVRRGDYATNPKHFPPVTDDYLIRAMSHIGQHNRFIFFSDDIQWCMEFTHRNFSAFDDVDFEYSQGKDEFADLSAMASCKHHIIANSSFSWWGAFLGHNPDKIVVCPSYKNWFGPENGVQNPKNIPCSNWIQIEY
jgi:hypothetical protein